MPTNLKTLYDIDFVRWSEQMGRLIRDRNYDQVDWENVIEEIESLGKSDRRELKSRLEVLLMHMLKWQYQPSMRTGSWTGTINEQRDRIEDLLEESPSLKSLVLEYLPDSYRRARRNAIAETGLQAHNFPIECPYTIAQVLDAEFLP
jgi:Domain of unknown function DUF29